MAKMKGAETLFFVLFLDCWQGAELHHPFHLIEGSPPPESSKNSEFESGSNKQEDYLARLFDNFVLCSDGRKVLCMEARLSSLVSESQGIIKSTGDQQVERILVLTADEIVLQVYSNVSFDEARTAEKSITKRAVKESHVLGEERKEPSLFNRAVQDRSAPVDKEAVKPDAQNRTVPCQQLLHFLQRNNLVAIGLVSAVLLAAVLLLVLWTIHVRKKQALHLPANMTYNIFIMSGKTWWQKSQEKNSKNNAGKQKQLNCDACA